MERYEAWQGIDGLDQVFSDITLHVDPRNTYARCCFWDRPEHPGRDVLVRFPGRVIAIGSFEEFVHPWNDKAIGGELPTIGSGRHQHDTYPILIVRESFWVSTLPNLFPYEGRMQHIRLVSSDNTVDVLMTGLVTADWVERLPSELVQSPSTRSTRE